MIAGEHHFEHTELCMGTVFMFQGRSKLPHGPHISTACDMLHEADRLFSTYKPESPISRLARGETSAAAEDPIINQIWDECLEWERVTDGWFSAFTPENTFDPSGLVKTWAAEGVTAFPKDQRSLQAAKAKFNSEAARWGKIIKDTNITVKQ